MANAQAPQDGAADPSRTKLGQFAVTNVGELVERLAYYGIVSINVLYLQSLGYSSGLIGVLSAILLPLPYVWPILTGAVAEKVGYKPTMLVGFVAYAAGFVLMASGLGLAVLVAGIVLLGLGAGMFKPLTAATIAHVTSLRHRSLGYSVYYMGINIGGFLGPVIAAVIGEHYQLAYLLGAAAMGADFVLILLFFRNPVPPQRATRIADAFKPLAEVFADRRFILLLAIFSGYWFLYSMNFSFLTLYLDRFVAHPSWFKPNLQQAIDPGLVMLVSVPIGALVKRFDAVKTMTAGIALAVAGFILVGFVPTFPAFVAGIAISTIGEVLAYPGFLSYVSRIAPKDRVAIYQGYGFLPIFAGFLLGPLAGGFLYGSVAEGAGRPALFWSLMAAVGLCTIAAFLLYGRAGVPRQERRAGGAALLPLAAATLLLVPLLVGAGLAVAPVASLAAPPPGPAAVLDQRTGTATEGQDVRLEFVLPAGPGNATLRLEWTDPAPAGALPGAVNAPDRFTVTVQQGARQVATGSAANALGGNGTMQLALPGLAGSFTVVLRLDAGDAGIQGLAVAPDTDAPYRLTLARPGSPA